MPPSLIGKTLLNRYRIEEFTARTPLGELHRAFDERGGKFVALTILPKSIAESSEAIKELEGKSRTLQEISHPNLIRYHGLRKTPTHTFLVEDWVDGPALTDILKKAPLSAEETLYYANSLARALEAIHNKNFLHAHLAPELIRINQRGEAQLGGIANASPIDKQTSHRLNRYPPHYTSPEALTDQPLTPAADIYSLAVILYQLSTNAWINGKQAPKAHDAIRKAHTEHTPPAPISLNKRIPDHFSRMILWALRKQPDDRLKTSIELISSLALALRVSQDEIPLRADGTIVPVTFGILQAWSFLPPPQAATIQDDAPPIEERVAALAAPQKKKPRRSLAPLLLLIIFAGLLSIFWFIRPATDELIDPIIEIPPTPTRFVVNITPTPSATPEPRPTFTNGGRIVFTCTRGDYNQLCMVNRDGSGLVQLTDMAASNYYPTFTIERDSILFASNRAGKFDLYLLAFNLKQTLQITSNVGDVVSPDYSPDGRTIVFANRVGDNPTAIWMVNADGLNPRLVYTGARDIVAVKWSPNGEQVAYAMSIGTAQDYEIYIMDANGRNHRRISERLRGVGGSIDWAADGSHVLIHAGPFGDKNIFRLDVNTGDFVQITKSGNNAGAAYSPDGRYIVFNSLRNENQADLYIMRTDGTNEVQLTDHPEPDWGAQWVE